MFVLYEDPFTGLQRVKTETDLDATVFLLSIGCELRLRDIYSVLESLSV